MDQHDDVLDEEVLSRLEDRLKRGIPKWEQAHFIEQVVPLLPETEFALALNAVGKDEAGWLLAFSTVEQRVACIDMDCFDLEGFQPKKMIGWIDAMIDAGLFRMLAPKAFGGLEVHPVDAFKVVEAVARIDSAAAWNLNQSSAVAVTR